MYLVFVHECGHFFTALFLNVEVDKIYIYPFGGISKINMNLNISQKKELIILIMGPIFQFIGYLILINIDFFKSYYQIIKIYNYGILCFNLLPIYPLDGGRLLNIFLSLKLNYKKSLICSIINSYLIVFFMFLIFIKNYSVNLLIIILFLLYKITFEYKKINYFYEKFLLERYLKGYEFREKIIINNINNFYRNRRHLIKIGDEYYTEKKILEKKYKKYWLLKKWYGIIQVLTDSLVSALGH